MLLSLSLIFIFGYFAGEICKKVHMPALLGMLAVGIIIGPYALNLLDSSVLSISADLRKIALIIILTRAGLSLDLTQLKKIGRPAVLMCFVPACFEILGMVLLAPALLGVSRTDAAIMGAVVGAVSPAVIVPKMIKLTEEGYGKDRGIPQLILAGASVDDVFVIVLFTAFVSLEQTGTLSAASFLSVPISILLGIGAGLVFGFAAGKIFKKFHVRDTVKLLLLFSLSFLLAAFEDGFGKTIPFSAMLAVMCVGIAINKEHPLLAGRLSDRYSKLWTVFEILLFVLVGACVNIQYALKAGPMAILLIFAVLLFRMAGVCLCVLKTELNAKERLFCMLAYLPKATVQAVIGGIPYAMGLPCGESVLTVAVLSILITAPLGAFLIDLTYKKCLNKKAD